MNAKEMNKNSSAFVYPCNIYSESRSETINDSAWTSIYGVESTNDFDPYVKIVFINFKIIYFIKRHTFYQIKLLKLILLIIILIIEAILLV